jgi:hypothetical protein
VAEEVVGSAYVVLRAITSKIKDDIQEGVKRGASGSDRDLRNAGEHIGETMGAKAGETAGEKIVETSTRRIRDDKGRFASVGRHVGDRIGDGVTRSRGLRNLGRRLGDAFRRSPMFDRAGGSIGGRIGRAIGRGIARVPLTPFVLAALLPMVGGALKVISAYVAAATALLASLGPVVAGSAAAGVGAYAALGTAIGAVTLALKTQSPMLDRFKDLMDGVKERFSGIGLSVQQAMLPQLGHSIEHITRALLPALDRGLTRTGEVIGNLSRNLARVTEQPVFKRAFADVLDNNNRLLGSLGRGLTGLAEALVYVMAEARPVTRVFGSWFRRLGEGAAASAKMGRKTGELGDFFQRAADSMREWGRILGNFGRGFGNVLKIAAPFGDRLTDSIRRVSRRFLEFTRSADGENKIATFFENALPVVRAFNRLVGAVVKALFGGLAKKGAGKGTVEFLDTLRTEMLPALGRIVDKLSKLSPALIDLTASFSKFLGALADSGAVEAYVKVMTRVFQVVNRALELPLVGKVAGWALALGAVLRVLSPLVRVVGLLGRALLFLGKTLVRSVIPALIRMGAAVLVAMGPVGWIILAVVALGAALVVLWKKSETFRKVVTNVWEAVKSGASKMWDSIVEGAAKLVAAVMALPSKLLALRDGFLSVGKALIGAFIEGMQGAGRLVSDIAGNIWDAVRGLLNSAISGINRALEFTISLPGPDLRINPPDIPGLASGGRVTRGTLAVIGEGREPETVLPDSLLRDFLGRARREGAADAADARPIVFNTQVYNPVAERTSDSIQRRLMTVAQLGLLEAQ